jgi:hypothetical protein
MSIRTTNMTPRMSPLVNIEYMASLIVGGALGNSLVGGLPATLIGAVFGAAIFFALSMTVLIVPISAGLWGYGVWFVMDLITQGNPTAPKVAALIAAVVAGSSHMKFLGAIQGMRPAKPVEVANNPKLSPYTKYVDGDGREYDKDGNEVV